MKRLILGLAPAVIVGLVLPVQDSIAAIKQELFAASLAAGITTYPSFNSQRLDQQLQLYAQYLDQFGVPDVLVVGSSRSLQGVDPTALEQALAEQGYGDLNVYNFGINGATAKVINLLLQRILTPEQLPRLIIWADGSRAFNSGRVDVTYNGIAASEGYQVLETGAQPIAFPNSDLSFALSDVCVEMPIAAPDSEAVPDSETTDAIARSGQSVSRQRLCLSPPGGSSRERAFVPQSSIAPDLEATGFQPVATRFDPATYYQQHPRVSGRYDTNYIPFRLEGEQTAATVAIAEFAQAQQISLVFVNLPLSQDYLDSTRQQYEQQFRQHMQQLAAREGFIFYDLSQRWQTRSDYFADPSHINQYGAEAVARQLAIESVIPWERNF